jgi:hypothetical protein
MDQARSGWWLASDGRWYPTQANANPAQSRRPPTSRAAITAGLSAAIVAGLVLLAVVASSSTGPAATAPAPTVTAPVGPARTLLNQAARDAGLERWVHIVVSATAGTTATVVTGDAGPSEGQQTVRQGSQSATAIYVGNVGYVHVDSVSLAQALGLTIAPAAVGRWISYTPSDHAYASVIQGLTLPSALGELLSASGHLTMGTSTTVDGQSVVPITAETRVRGGQLVKATIDVTRSAHPLPVEINASSTGASETVIFSQWGVAVAIAAPSGAQPAASFAG